MTRDVLHRRLAILGAILAIGLFLSANAHLIAVAIGSQPACVATPDRAPARPAC